MIDVGISSTIPTPEELDRRLSDAERQVLLEYQKILQRHYQEQWVDWRYDKRPEGDPRLVSYDAWASRVDSTVQGPAIIIENKARDYRYGKDYVGYVHRAGDDTPEWVKLSAEAEKNIVPDLIEDLAGAIADAHEKPGRSRKIREGTAPTETLSLEL